MKYNMTEPCDASPRFMTNEKRNRPHQMMRICERVGVYDRTKLNMETKVR